MKESFKINFKRLTKPDKIVVAYLSGSFDSTSIDLFAQPIQIHISTGINRFVLNLHDLDYINSTAIKELLRVYQQAVKAGGFVYLVSVSPNISEVLNLVGITQIIPIFDTNQEVLNAIQQQK